MNILERHAVYMMKKMVELKFSIINVADTVISMTELLTEEDVMKHFTGFLPDRDAIYWHYDNGKLNFSNSNGDMVGNVYQCKPETFRRLQSTLDKTYFSKVYMDSDGWINMAEKTVGFTFSCTKCDEASWDNIAEIFAKDLEKVFTKVKKDKYIFSISVEIPIK